MILHSIARRKKNDQKLIKRIIALNVNHGKIFLSSFFFLEFPNNRFPKAEAEKKIISLHLLDRFAPLSPHLQIMILVTY